MSRAGYVEDCDDVLAEGRWRAAVNSAMGGRRGQAFLKELLAAMDALPAKRLAREALQVDEGMPFHRGDVCALGSVGLARGIDVTVIDPYDNETVASTFGIADAMAREIMFWNDEGGTYRETPEQRFVRMREWVAKSIRPPT